MRIVPIARAEAECRTDNTSYHRDCPDKRTSSAELSGPTTRGNTADRRPIRLEVLSFLALPDCGATNGKDVLYVNSYWRADTPNRCVAMVDIENDLLKSIGWNEATLNVFSMLTQYRKWSDVLRPMK